MKRTNFKEFQPVMCDFCDHYDGVGVNNEGYQVQRCKAFPNGIPIEITDGAEHHIKKIKGDNGVRFDNSSIAKNGKNMTMKEKKELAKTFPLMYWSDSDKVY
jgi:hypothetical protein